MLGNSIKNGCKNLYLHSKSFKITFKSNSYQRSISCRGLVTLSTTFFPNINLTKKIEIYLLFQNHRKMATIISISTVMPLMRKLFSYLTSLSPRGLVNPSTPTFGSINLTENKFNCCLEIQSKMAARISICTLNPLKLHSNQIHIWCQFSVVAW